MSHSSPKQGVTPSAQFAARNTQSSLYPGRSLQTDGKHSNKLIPRDYLDTRTRNSPSATGPSPKSSPLSVSSTDLQHTARHINPGARVSPPPEQEISRQQSGDASDKENEGLDEDLKVSRTRSPESIASTAFSIDSGVTGDRPAVPNSNGRVLPNSMPRTSSIDSAISSVSNSSIQHKTSGDTRDLSPASLRNLMASAGSAENLVSHLLKEKNHSAHQNAQLWKLVEKQRTLLLGLNKDLERVTKERDKYKKKLKEVVGKGNHARASTHSPVRSGQQLASQAPPNTLPDELSRDELSRATSKESDDQPEVRKPVIAAQQRPNEASGKPRRPTLQASTSELIHPTFSVTEATPMTEKPPKGFSASRKATPAPLNLAQSNSVSKQPLMNPEDRARLLTDDDEDDSDNDDYSRGRRKTREEDDREREDAIVRESEARSMSKKERSANNVPTEVKQKTTLTAQQPPFTSLPASPRPPNLALGNATSLNAGLAPPLKSPGLPSSPRPANNTAGFTALPTSPRANMMPLSPRAPKQPIPAPMMSPSPFADPTAIQKQTYMAKGPTDRLQVHEPSSSSDAPPVYRGLSSPAYPNLLLPPNAIPSIQIKVASSRLRPSRHSMLGLKTQEDATVFSLSVYSRASRNELWRVEKIPAALPMLEQQLRPLCKDLPRLPDRRIFSGHSPATIDARRTALDAYFEDLLDLEMDEKSALIICKFLSDDVLDPEETRANFPRVNQESLIQTTSLSGRPVRTGFLTKRGKNFGGWKSRYFVLDSPELRYYETTGGPHLGTIKLQHARIGSQRSDESAHVDAEDQYRHAFLIQEPKKKDSNQYVRHVLCAESDAERDAWVAALVYYTEDEVTKEMQGATLQNYGFPPVTPVQSRNPGHRDSVGSSPASPAGSVYTTDSPATETARSAAISRPMNGAPIADSAQWGNKPAAAPVASKDKAKGGFFHFKKSSSEHLQQTAKQQEQQAAKPRILRHNGYVRAVFGLPLSEAVEYCRPFNVDVRLPAVVYRCLEYLRHRNAANEEGLFRLSGSNILIKNLKERFNTEGDVDLVDEEEYYDVHAVASLLKTYLRELPSSILTRDLHIEFLRVLDLTEQSEKVYAFHVLVHRLPQINFELLRALSRYLLEVTENSAKNKMSVRNIGIVFSPTLNIPTPVFDLFLREFDAIFGRGPSPVASAGTGQQLRSTEVQVTNNNLAPADVRSPRHQMFSDIPTPAYDQTNFPDRPNEQSPQHTHHGSSGSGEFGFTPIHPSYEAGAHPTNPNAYQESVPKYAAIAPSHSHHTAQQQAQMQMGNDEMYGSLNNMLVPRDAASAKAKRRESAMLF